MGNEISRASGNILAQMPMPFAEERGDIFTRADERLPADFSDMTARLADIGLSLPQGKRLAVREGSTTQARLREALITLAAVTPETPRAASPALRDAHLEAMALLMRLGALDHLMPTVAQLEGTQVALVMPRGAPFWMHAILAGDPAQPALVGARQGEPIDDTPASAGESGETALSELQRLPLHLAGLTLQAQKMRELIRDGLDVNARDSQGRTPLFAAVTGGDPDCLSALLEAGADINACEKNGRSALSLALQVNKPAVARLIRAGARLDTIDKEGLTPLTMAVNLDRPDLVDRLISAGADLDVRGADSAPLHHAIMMENFALASRLLKAGADPHRIGVWSVFQPQSQGRGSDKTEITPVELAVLRGNLRITKLLQRHGVDLAAPTSDGGWLINLAAATGNLDMINALLAEGAKAEVADTKGRGPLHWAAAHGHTEVIRRLLARGLRADVTNHRQQTLLHVAVAGASEDNIANKCDTVELLLATPGININAHNDDGDTPLHYAARGQDSRLIEALLKGRPRLDARNHDGMTPLHSAALSKNIRGMVALIRARAEIDATDKQKRTPLHHAAAAGHLAAVELLLTEGARVNLRDRNKLMPIHAAAHAGDEDTLRVLIRYGADLNAEGTNGLTALDIARLGGHLDLVERLSGEGSTSQPQRRLAR